MNRHILHTTRGLSILFLVVLSTASFDSVAKAQPSQSEHEKHHPKKSKTAGGVPDNAGPGMMKDMGKMMEKMGAPKPRDLYPSLMRLPDLPPEERAAIQEQAHERMKSGAAMMAQGLESLSQAASTDDFAAMQQATATLREGMAQFESGLAAHRALVEGKAPRAVALQWFKREMNLLPPESEKAGGIFGMSWFHAFIMLLLISFAVAMIGMYFLKMRRATFLLQRLVADETAGPADTATSEKTIASQGDSAIGTSPSPATSQESDSQEPSETSDATAVVDCCADARSVCRTDAPTEGDKAIGGLLRMPKRKLCRLRVARIEQETPDVKTFRFVACHDGGVPFNYLPGQFLTLTLPVGDKPIRRSYTISSSPTQGYYCEITVKREEHGAGSRYLHDQVKVGDTIEVQAPSGKFVFAGEDDDSIVLIAGGVGITPMMSITRALTDMVWDGDIYFIVACRDPEHFIFESELKQLQERYPNLHVFAVMSRIDQDVNGYRHGRLSHDLLAEVVPDIASKRIHLCGPLAMMDATKRMLEELKVPASNIHTENFGGEQKPRVRAEERAKNVNTKIAQVGGQVTFNKSKQSTHFQPDETILEAAERVGVDIDYSCRVGMCGVCTVKLLSGEVTMEVEDGLEPDDKAAGIILACEAKSTGDVVVDV